MNADARSLFSKLEDVRLLVNLKGAAVIAISESWLDNTSQDDKVAIDDYRIVRNNRNCHGRGVAFYVWNSLAYNTPPNLNNPASQALKPSRLKSSNQDQNAFQFVLFVLYFSSP